MITRLYDELLREHRLSTRATRATSEEATPEDTLTYASGQDSAIHYSKNQERWKAFSVKVMNELIGNISENTGEFSIFEPSMSNGPQRDSDFENIF